VAPGPVVSDFFFFFFLDPPPPKKEAKSNTFFSPFGAGRERTRTPGLDHKHKSAPIPVIGWESCAIEFQSVRAFLAGWTGICKDQQNPESLEEGVGPDGSKEIFSYPTRSTREAVRSTYRVSRDGEDQPKPRYWPTKLVFLLTVSTNAPNKSKPASVHQSSRCVTAPHRRSDNQAVAVYKRV